MFKKTFTPRMSEVVGGRHIRNDVLAIWSVEGFIEVQEMFNRDIWQSSLIMANLNLDYLSEIVWGHKVEVMTGVKAIGNTSFVLEQNFIQKSRLCARALVTLLHYDYVNRRPESIPEGIRDRLSEYLVNE